MATYQENSALISPEILQAVEKMGFIEMTEVQAKAIPVMIDGKDVIAKAPTGTGKTCAFGIPMIQKIDPQKKSTQGLVLCPTRELCCQIRDELRQLAQFIPGLEIAAVYGGQPIAKQFAALNRNPQIVVATPGRLLDHMNRRTVNLKNVKLGVLDEADEMLDMGFMKDVRKILDTLPAGRQLAMFSATISREVMDISWLYQRDEVEITVKPVRYNEPKITQFRIASTGTKKLNDLVAILRTNGYKRSIIFCNTKYATTSLTGQLTDRGFQAACLNGDMRQSDRTRIMNEYRAGRLPILVATDVAARGIDVSDVDAVFNYEVPLENEYYLHRIGRTGRARREGDSFTFYSEQEQKHLDQIIRYTRSVVTELRVLEDGTLEKVSE